MSRDDFTEIEEMVPNNYQVRYGQGENKGRDVLYTDDLKLAIKTAKQYGAEYGIYFIFLDDKQVN